MEWHDLVGSAGVLLILCAYFALQAEKLAAHSLAYLWMNLSGATLVIVSLTQEFNLSAFVVEAFWVLISIMGLIRRGRSTPRRFPLPR